MMNLLLYRQKWHFDQQINRLFSPVIKLRNLPKWKPSLYVDNVAVKQIILSISLIFGGATFHLGSPYSLGCFDSSFDFVYITAFITLFACMLSFLNLRIFALNCWSCGVKTLVVPILFVGMLKKMSRTHGIVE